jgi:hypothetical protein
MKLDVNRGLVIDSIDQVFLIGTLEVHLRPTRGYVILSKSDVTYIYPVRIASSRFMILPLKTFGELGINTSQLILKNVSVKL